MKRFLKFLHTLGAIGKWLLLPSLVIVLASGLLSIAAHRPCMNARWTWLKAVLGLSMFEGTLVGIRGPAEHAGPSPARHSRAR